MWITTVSFGVNPMPRGPWRSAPDARAAITRRIETLGAEAGSLIAMRSVRAQAYMTRAQARTANINDDYRDGLLWRGDARHIDIDSDNN